MKKPQPNRSRVRLTVDLRPEVYEVFRTIAEAQRLGIGRTIGDWLDDTQAAARYSADVIERARSNPAEAASSLQRMASALGTITESLAEQAGTMAVGGRGRPLAGDPPPKLKRPAPSPPLGNTGGKVPQRKGKPS